MRKTTPSSTYQSLQCVTLHQKRGQQCYTYTCMLARVGFFTGTGDRTWNGNCLWRENSRQFAGGYRASNQQNSTSFKQPFQQYGTPPASLSLCFCIGTASVSSSVASEILQTAVQCKHNGTYCSLWELLSGTYKSCIAHFGANKFFAMWHPLFDHDMTNSLAVENVRNSTI